MTAKILYGATFGVVLPVLLVWWAVAAQHNVRLPEYGSEFTGYAIAAGGLWLMLTAMRELWRLGGGLPMNAFPPKKLVRRGTFHWLPHPIYTGFTAICLGTAMVAKSPAGLWLVTPTVALGCAALVIGYELPDLQQRFGETLRVLPANDDSPPSNRDRLRYFLVVMIPWILLYEFTVKMRVPGHPFRLEFENGLPIFPWTALVYQSCYVTATLAPWSARTRRDLRQLSISVWVAMAVVFPIYWLMPSSAPRRAMADEGWLAHTLAWERNTYPPAAAFPSFHVLWAIFVGRLYRPRWLGVAYAVVVSVSCITTGMHYIPDLLASVVMSPLFLRPQRVWTALLRGAEALANSWREWRLGPVRIINHGFYAGAGALVHVAIVAAALGPGNEWKAAATSAAGLVGAAVWAQWVEGSTLLRRPFGFYGGLIGVAAACLFFEQRWLLLAAHCLAAPWLQAIGRLRCLVNGCCHGALSPRAEGIRVTHERSRVTRLARLAGKCIYPTQLYSILGNVFVGLVVLRLWTAGCPVSLICGVYAIGNGLARFVEEAYRGEPQTLVIWGLRLYQWIAVACVMAGIVLTTMGAPLAPRLIFTVPGGLWALVFGAICAGALGVDFPETDRPLARLT
jgi:protein-S-isoprenylcysteine O-methyltransferase Ste14